jgi:hypothetical protein
MDKTYTGRNNKHIFEKAVLKSLKALDEPIDGIEFPSTIKLAIHLIESDLENEEIVKSLMKKAEAEYVALKVFYELYYLKKEV